MAVTEASLRTPIRPLGQILSARANGEDPRVIERENIKRRQDHTIEGVRLRAQGRLLVLGIMFLCLFAAITLRIGLLASSEPAEPKSQRAGASIIAQRADIVDRHGRILATNMDTHSLYVETAHLVDPEGTANALAEVFRDLDAKKLFENFTGKRKFLWIKRKMSPEQMQAAHDIGDPGLRFGPREMRLYPNGRLAAHVLGGSSFGREGVHAAEVIGVAGVEKTFDAHLRNPAKSGQAMHLSIDLSVQAAVEQVLHGGMKLLNAKGAAAILMDAYSGELIAITSLPDFDPNHIMLSTDAARFNQVTKGVYEMGSIFKVLNTAIALETGAIDMHRTVDVSKPIPIAGQIINDYKPINGSITLAEILVRSSNIGSAHISQMIGPKTQRKYMKQLGLLEPSSLEIVENGVPLVPDDWSNITAMTVSYGYGLSVSMVQAAAAIAAAGGDTDPDSMTMSIASD